MSNRALTEKVKADRLRRIMGQAPVSGQPAAAPTSATSPPTQNMPPPVSTQGSSVPGPQQGDGVSVPTAASQMTCPTHPSIRLVQVRDRLTGKDIFRCPEGSCQYQWKSDDFRKNTKNPDTVERDPITGYAKCPCGYTTKPWTVRKAGPNQGKRFLSLPCTGEKAVQLLHVGR